MSGRGPDFEELVGSDLEPAERDRLLRIHDLLVAAGPPPELPSRLVEPPAPRGVFSLRRRGRAAALALAAAVGVLVFTIGFLAGDRRDDPGTFDVVAMTGAGPAAGASASLEVFDVDAAGNWPLEMRATGLLPSASGRSYELWLTKSGRLGALCGSFRAEPDGTTVVPMNAPYKLNEFDGWVVVEEGSEVPLLTT